MEHKGTVRLETPRLILRRFEIEDAQAAFEAWTSDDEVTKYLTWPTHKSVEGTKGFLNYCINGYENPETYQWAIELKETGKVIGNISVVRTDANTDSAELGWVLGMAYWGRGIMPEAAKEVIRFLFEEVGTNRICAEHDTNNPKSGRVMQKVGMKHEGVLRSAGRNNQGIVDVAVYSILKCEY